MRKLQITVAAAFAAVLAAGCQSMSADGPKATANLEPTGNAGARSACAVIQRS